VSPDSTAATKSAAPAPSPEGGTVSSNDAAEGEAMSDIDGVAEPAAKKIKRSGRKSSEWAYHFFLHEVKGRKTGDLQIVRHVRAHGGVGDVNVTYMIVVYNREVWYCAEPESRLPPADRYSWSGKWPFCEL
jgi:hypothetical protein